MCAFPGASRASWSSSKFDEAILGSNDWRLRVYDAAATATRAEAWSDPAFIHRRHQALVGGADPVRLPSQHLADVAYVNDPMERAWSEKFYRITRNHQRCRQLMPFDKELLFDIPAAGTTSRSEDSSWRPYDLRASERRIRNATGRFVGGHEYRTEYFQPNSMGTWPRVPALFNELEVPYALNVPTPLVVRLHGLEMAQWSDIQETRDRAPEVWAMWCACSTLFVRDAVAEFLFELSRGRLMWLPSRLAVEIHNFTPLRLCGTPNHAEVLSKALLSIGRVNWRKVDPAVSIRPKRNPHIGPFFHNGDHVPWNERGRDGGELDVVPELLLPAEVPIQVRGTRGPRIGLVDLTLVREPTVGHGRRPGHWRGVFVDKARLSGATPQERKTADRMRGKRPVRPDRSNPMAMAWTPRQRDRRHAPGTAQPVNAERPVEISAPNSMAPGTRGDTPVPRLVGKRGLTVEPAWSVRKRRRADEGSTAQVVASHEGVGVSDVSMEDLQGELESAKTAVIVEKIGAASSITIHPLARELMATVGDTSRSKGLRDFVNHRLTRGNFPW